MGLKKINNKKSVEACWDNRVGCFLGLGFVRIFWVLSMAIHLASFS